MHIRLNKNTALDSCILAQLASVASWALVSMAVLSEHKACTQKLRGRLVQLSCCVTCCRLNWRQVWSCVERAQQGPWRLDVQALTPAAAPNGVLLTFELLLQQPAPMVDASGSDQQSAGWRDSVTVISFELDKKTVEIVVDAAGR